MLIMVSCSDGENQFYLDEKIEENIHLNLTMNYPLESNYYRIDYPDEKLHHYISVEYKTRPLTRIFWSSIDSFTIDHMGYPITYPIINFSTISREKDGTGKQFIYLYQNFINDTLMIRGCITELNCEELEFIIY